MRRSQKGRKFQAAADRHDKQTSGRVRAGGSHRARGWLECVRIARSLIRRTIRTASQEIAEGHWPRLSWTAATVLENDTDTIPTMPTMGGDAPVDQHSWYGRVGYTFAGAIDQPISVTRYYFRRALRRAPLLVPLSREIISRHASLADCNSHRGIHRNGWSREIYK